MNSTIKYDRIVPVEQMVGEDDEETAQLKQSLEEARNYMKSHPWCRSIKREFFGLGIGGVVSVFLFEILGGPGVDDCLWVVCGNLPPAYLVVDNAGTPSEALNVYCSLMDDWIAVARRNGDLSQVFPISADPTEDNATLLEKRVAFLRREVIPAFE
jgi:hypothetical protein